MFRGVYGNFDIEDDVGAQLRHERWKPDLDCTNIAAQMFSMTMPRGCIMERKLSRYDVSKYASIQSLEQVPCRRPVTELQLVIRRRTMLLRGLSFYMLGMSLMDANERGARTTRRKISAGAPLTKAWVIPRTAACHWLHRYRVDIFSRTLVIVSSFANIWLEI